jgi:Uma2 family endonuclease
MEADRVVVTAKDFDEWALLPENVEENYEFISGEIVAVVSNSYDSQVAALILVQILVYVRKKSLGWVTGADGGYQVGEERYIPDVGFLSVKRQPEPPRESYISMAPDLAVEVVSPTDSALNLRVKVANYLLAGSNVWMVDPDAKTVEVYQPGKTALILGADDTIPGGDALPGFSLPVTDIFPAEPVTPPEPAA